MDAPPAPRTPSPRARRLLFSYPPLQTMFAVIGLITLLMGLMVYRIFGPNVPSDVAITLFGSKTSGTIVSRALDGHMSVDNVHPTRFEFGYVASGASMSAHSYAVVVPAALAYSPKVDVEYLSLAPEYARVAGTTRNEGGDDIGWFMAAMIGFGSTSLAVPWWLMRRKRLAFVNGVAASGAITFVGQSSVSINGRKPKKIAWTFTDPRGRSYGGSLSAFNWSDLPQFNEGERVTVLYDERDPTANILFVE
ncbi:MAG TPA: DUF3592 domain-containing protein [Polyangiaceae bacterium]|jgi:hypothetical protein